MSRTKKVRGFLLRLGIVTILAFCGCGERPHGYPQRQLPEGFSTDATQLSAGAVLFKDKCASCHGKPSEGRSERASFFNPPAPDFTEKYYSDIDPAYLYWRIDSGKGIEPYRSQGSVMPAWGAHLSGAQIWQLVVYLQARGH